MLTLASGASAQQDSVGAGQIDNPENFKAGHSSSADTATNAENASQLDGNTLDELKDEVQKSCLGQPYWNGSEYVRRTVASGETERRSCGRSWRVTGFETWVCIDGSWNYLYDRCSSP